MRPCWLSVIAAGLLVHSACTGKSQPNPSGEIDADADSDTDSDSDTDTDADSDVPLAVLLRKGSAVADIDGYAGTEEWTLTGASGYGDLLCHTTTTLTSVAARTDCSTCAWAFDLVLSGSVVLVDVDGACDLALGVSAADIASWDGTQKTYGYDPEYVGHAEVLMTPSARGEWGASTYVDYDEATGTLTYEWIDGELSY